MSIYHNKLAVFSLGLVGALLSACHSDSTPTAANASSSIHPRVASVPAGSASVCLLADAFGASTTNPTNVSAFNAALTALPPSGGCIQFGPGKYNFLSPVTFPYPSGSIPYNVSIYGAGQETTILNWPSSDGLNLTLNHPKHTFNLASLTISTGKNGAYTGFTATNTWPMENFGQNNIDQVTFRGEDGGMGANFWYNAVNLVGVSNVRFDGDLFYGSATPNGNGIVLNGNTGVTKGAGHFGLVYYIDNTGFFNEGIGLAYGNLIQGVHVSNANFTNSTTGIYSVSGATGGAQLSVTNSQFDTSANAIHLNSPISQVAIANNLFYVHSSNSGIYCAKCSGISAVGNNFSYYDVPNNGQNGIVIVESASAIPSTIIGNTFYGLTTAVWLQSLSKNVNVQSNAYVSNSSNVVNSGTGNTIGGGSQ